MKKFLLIVSGAAMAVAMPALAEPGKGNGQGNKGGGAAKADRGPSMKAKGNDTARANPGNSGKSAQKAEKQQFKAVQKDNRGQVKSAERAFKAQDRQVDRVRQIRDDDFDRRDDYRRGDYRRGDVRQAASFCPPGLAKKNNGCLPPGQAKKVYGRGDLFDANRYGAYNLPSMYRGFYSDNPSNYYRYDDDGYIYRVDRQSNLVSGLIPLLGGGFGVGQMLPSGYDVYNVPSQYRDNYYDTADANYRYGDNAIYQVDPQTSMIESVVALLTGSNLGVGQTLPAGYDAYNLPVQYRDDYADGADYNYRYADGNIYQVDTKTQIIQAIISALI